MKPVLLGMLAMLLTLEPVSGQHSFYVKLEPQARKALPAMKAGTEVALREFPLETIREAGSAQVVKVMHIGLSSAPETQGIFRVDCANDSLRDVLMRSLAEDPVVAYVEPTPRRRFSVAQPAGMENLSRPMASAPELPDDPYYQDSCFGQYSVRWHLDMIDIEEAWKVAKGKPEIKVAVVDNAVWGEHEDLQIPTSLQYNAMTGEACSAPPASWDNTRYYEQEDSISTIYLWSHGTHCAGLVGALTGNGTGIASLAGGVTLMGVRVATDTTPRYTTFSTEGIAWAVENGANVISMSFGGIDTSRVEHELIKAAAAEGTVFVAAAGNDAEKDVYDYPAAYPEVISVGSCDQSGFRSYFTNYGDWVDIWAPGGFSTDGIPVFSTTYSYAWVLGHVFEDLQYKYYDAMQGTSMATPIVSSLCALMLSYDSTLNHEEIRSILRASANLLTSPDISLATGVIDAGAAMHWIEEYGRPSPVSFLESFQVDKVVESRNAILSWQVDSSACPESSYLRLYRNKELFLDHVAPDMGMFVDTTLAVGHRYCYEVCEVDSQGRESFRLSDTVMIPEWYEMRLTVDPEGAGTVSGAGVYESGSTIVITATANPGWVFKSWGTGLRPYTSDTLEVVITQDLHYTAQFKPDDAALEASAPVSWRVVPNPVRTEIFIEGLGDADVERVLLYDMQSRLLHAWESGSGPFSVEDVPAGMYVLEVRFANGPSSRQKIVVGY